MLSEQDSKYKRFIADALNLEDELVPYAISPRTLKSGEIVMAISGAEDHVVYITKEQVVSFFGINEEELQSHFTNELIKEIAFKNKFTERQQPDGSMDLNPYVYDFARELIEKAFEIIKEK